MLRGPKLGPGPLVEKRCIWTDYYIIIIVVLSQRQLEFILFFKDLFHLLSEEAFQTNKKSNCLQLQHLTLP